MEERENLKKLEYVSHPFEPIFDGESRVLILGSIPSPKSRENGFYYGHPRNRFWPVLARVLGEPEPRTVEEKQAMALRRHVAVWDVLAGCEIHGADDASIRRPRANDMSRILDHTPVSGIFTTGTRAGDLYRRYCLPATGREAVVLPSTSPANCRVGLEALVSVYAQIKRYL